MATAFGIKMTWDKFTEFECWDQFPEREDDPPYTAEVNFMYKGKEYFLDGIADQKTHKMDYIWYEILPNDDYVEFARFDNFLKAVNAPLFDGRSFKERIREFEFAY